MQNTFQNWTYRTVANLLKSHGFSLSHIRGNHYYLTGTVRGLLCLVCIPYHNNDPLNPRILKSIVQQSHIPEENWLKPFFS